MTGSEVVKLCEVLSISVSTINTIYIDHTKFAVCMTYSFITLFHILLVPILSECVCLCMCVHTYTDIRTYIHGCMFCVFLFKFVNYVFLLLSMFRSVYYFSLCCSVYCLCVNVYCTAATGCQPYCS
jgi:hypothetical protein